MPLARFLETLAEAGRPALRGPEPLEPGEIEAADPALRALDARSRDTLPLTPPPLALGAARWGAATLYQASQLLAFRALGADAVLDFARRQGPAPCPASAYAIDLTLQHLPELVALARAAAPADPLCEALMRLARRWPLSSVGIRDLGPTNPGSFLRHPSLRALYVDRILLAEDAGRLDRPEVRDAVRDALGLHPELCPVIARALARSGP